MKKLIFILLLVVSGGSSVVHAQGVDILWQANTYTPPFYEGRALWSTQSGITLVAIPQGLDNPSNLNYKWSRNSTVLGSSSGVGKNSLAFLDSILSKPQTITVEIVRETGDGETVLAKGETTVTPTKPFLLVYENNPLYGFMFHQAISDEYKLPEGEVTFTAFPYFFGAASRLSPDFTYEWRTNTGGLETRGSVTYRAPEDASGSSQVSLRVLNKKSITQDLRKGFLVKFGE